MNRLECLNCTKTESILLAGKHFCANCGLALGIRPYALSPEIAADTNSDNTETELINYRPTPLNNSLDKPQPATMPTGDINNTQSQQLAPYHHLPARFPIRPNEPMPSQIPAKNEINSVKSRKKRKIPKHTFLIARLAGVAAIIIILVITMRPHKAIQAALPQVTKSPPKPVVVKPAPVVVHSSPLRLKIPVINVDAAVGSVGLTKAGAMDAPKTPEDAAWYKLGPRPGEVGSAVIDGHYGWINNIPAVFDNIHRLKVGDNIYIDDDKGTSIAFVITRVKTFGENDNATEVFNSNDGKAHLNLITCQGTWNKSKASYADRLVVFTDLMQGA